MNLSSPPEVAVYWIVWSLDDPTKYCTVSSKGWFSACKMGAAILVTERVDARLKSEKIFEESSTNMIDECICCQNNPCTCITTTKLNTTRFAKILYAFVSELPRCLPEEMSREQQRDFLIAIIARDVIKRKES